MIRQFFMVAVFLFPRISLAQGIVLEKISQNSLLYQQGVRQSDTLLAVNGEKIESVAEARKIFASLKSSKKVQLLIKPASSPNKVRTLIIQQKKSLPLF